MKWNVNVKNFYVQTAALSYFWFLFLMIFHLLFTHSLFGFDTFLQFFIFTSTLIRVFSVFFFLFFIVSINYSDHYRTLDRWHHTPNGAIIGVTFVMNLSVEPRALVFVCLRRSSPLSTPAPLYSVLSLEFYFDRLFNFPINC